MIDGWMGPQLRAASLAEGHDGWRGGGLLCSRGLGDRLVGWLF
jgi:hypothetical protein